MEIVSDVDKLESIRSMQSTIRKLENSLTKMTQKDANTTLIKKRLKASYIGLAMLENAWNQKAHDYSQADITEARNVLTGLFPSIESSFAKLKAGSPQRTLLERRIKALKLAVQAIDHISSQDVSN